MSSVVNTDTKASLRRDRKPIYNIAGKRGVLTSELADELVESRPDSPFDSYTKLPDENETGLRFPRFLVFQWQASNRRFPLILIDPVMHRLTIRVTTSYPHFPLERQLPGTSRQWGNCKFVINEPCGPCDWWVVASGLITPESGYCDPAHTVFVANEPAERTYPHGFLEQFAVVISCDPKLHHRGRVQTQYGLPWWAGVTMSLQQPHQFSRVARFGYDDFKAMVRPAKPKRMSVISSRLTHFEGHIKRAAFVEELKRRFAREIDFFGYDSNPLPDKWDGLAQYRYHVCLENTVGPDYWTEKIADPLLAYCLPIYSGCSNIADYFPEGSFLPINIQETDEACGEIERLLAVDPYEEHATSVVAARELLLDKYNFFAMITNLCKTPARRKTEIRLKPENSVPVRRTLLSRAKGLARRVAPTLRRTRGREL